jgi:hypothetical protein
MHLLYAIAITIPSGRLRTDASSRSALSMRDIVPGRRFLACHGKAAVLHRLAGPLRPGP